MIEIHHQLYIHASCAKVFVAISSQKGLSKWWGDTGDIRTDYGALVPFCSVDGKIQTLKIMDAKLTQSLIWNCVDGCPEWKGTEITFDLTKEENGTLLSFKHSGWLNYNDIYARTNYHWSRRLSYLKELCETGKISDNFLQEMDSLNFK